MPKSFFGLLGNQQAKFFFLPLTILNLNVFL